MAVKPNHRRKAGAVYPGVWLNACRSDRSCDPRGGNNSNGNCWEYRLITDTDGRIIAVEFGDSKLRRLLGDAAPVFRLDTNNVVSLINHAETNAELADTDFYVRLALPCRLSLVTQELLIVPLIANTVEAGTHMCFFDGAPGLTFAAAETAAFFRFLTESDITSAPGTTTNQPAQTWATIAPAD